MNLLSKKLCNVKTKRMVQFEREEDASSSRMNGRWGAGATCIFFKYANGLFRQNFEPTSKVSKET